MNKKISIIVPVYNEINTVETILTNLINLKIYNNVEKEIIIIDDSSTDGSTEIIRKFETTYSYVKAIYKTINKGKGDSKDS